MNNKIIISDASPLIAFARINLLSLLSKLFGQIITTEQVSEECLTDLSRKDAEIIQAAIEKKIITIKKIPNTDLFNKLSEILGIGEASAITLALELKSPLLIDERLGRQIAENYHLKIIGTAGVLLLAKKQKLITEIKPLINALKKSGYYLSDTLIKEILKQSKEK